MRHAILEIVPIKGRFWTVEEVAAMTGRSVPTVYSLIRRAEASGKPMGKKVARSWLLSDKDLERIRAIPLKKGRPFKHPKHPKAASAEHQPPPPTEN